MGSRRSSWGPGLTAGYKQVTNAPRALACYEISAKITICTLHIAEGGPMTHRNSFTEPAAEPRALLGLLYGVMHEKPQGTRRTCRAPNGSTTGNSPTSCASYATRPATGPIGPRTSLPSGWPTAGSSSSALAKRSTPTPGRRGPPRGSSGPLAHYTRSARTAGGEVADHAPEWATEHAATRAPTRAHALRGGRSSR